MIKMVKIQETGALLSHPSTNSQKRVPLQERLPYDISQFTTKFTQADKNFILELDNEISRYIFYLFRNKKRALIQKIQGNFEFYLPASNKDFSS